MFGPSLVDKTFRLRSMNFKLTHMLLKLSVLTSIATLCDVYHLACYSSLPLLLLHGLKLNFVFRILTKIYSLSVSSRPNRSTCLFS